MFHATTIAVVVLCLVAGTSHAELIIGGWDASRGGSYSLRDGALTNTLREGIRTEFPGASLTASSVLTDDYLTGVNLLFISSVRETDNVPITPLTTAEQAALLRFVNAGGSAVIFTDNENYMTASNSLVGPFGLHSTGVLFFDIPARVTDPLAHPVTDGPFGLVSTFTTFFPGWFDSVGPVAQPLARLDPVDQVALAVIDPGTLSPTSGAVAFFSDSSMLENPRFTGSNRSVVLNAVEFGKLTVVPEPATWVLFGLGLFLLAGYSWGSGRRNLVGKPQ